MPRQNENELPPIVNLSDAARLAGCQTKTILAWYDAGEFVAGEFEGGGGHGREDKNTNMPWRIKTAALERVAAEHGRPLIPAALPPRATLLALHQRDQEIAALKAELSRLQAEVLRATAHQSGDPPGANAPARLPSIRTVRGQDHSDDNCQLELLTPD